MPLFKNYVVSVELDKTKSIKYSLKGVNNYTHMNPSQICLVYKSQVRPLIEESKCNSTVFTFIQPEKAFSYIYWKKGGITKRSSHETFRHHDKVDKQV